MRSMCTKSSRWRAGGAPADFSAGRSWVGLHRALALQLLESVTPSSKTWSRIFATARRLEWSHPEERTRSPDRSRASGRWRDDIGSRPLRSRSPSATPSAAGCARAMLPDRHAQTCMKPMNLKMLVPQSASSPGFSSSFFTYTRKRAPSAPSARRWSTLHEKFMYWRTSILSPSASRRRPASS